MKDTFPEIIPLSAGLLDSYRKIVIDTFRQTFDRHNSPENMKAYLDQAADPGLLAKDLDTRRTLVFLAQQEGQTVGYLKLNFPPAFTHPVEGNAMEIERIYVDVSCHGKSYGAALMQRAISEGRKQKAGFLWLGVWEQNEKAKAFYLKKGFVVFGSHRFVLGGDSQNDLLMRLEIDPGKTDPGPANQ